MANNREKGTRAETLVKDYLAQWALPNDDGRGEQWKRVPSGQRIDRADVHGPYTAIEVKNQPSALASNESAFLDEAMTKCGASGLRFGLLVARPPKIGARRVGQWLAATTVEQLIHPEHFAVAPQDIDAATFIADLPTLCKKRAQVKAVVSRPLKEARPDATREVRILCDNFVLGRAARRAAILAEYDASADASSAIPIVVSPRRLGGALLEPDQWFAYMRLSDAARLLAAEGVLLPTITPDISVRAA